MNIGIVLAWTQAMQTAEARGSRPLFSADGLGAPTLYVHHAQLDRGINAVLGKTDGHGVGACAIKRVAATASPNVVSLNSIKGKDYLAGISTSKVTIRKS